MKRIICFVIVVFVICSIPVLAVDENEKQVVINNQIYLYSEKGLENESSFVYNKDNIAVRDSFDKMLTILLHNTTIPAEYITLENVQTWRLQILLLMQVENDYLFRDSLLELEKYINVDNKDMYIGFSSEFVLEFEEYFQLFLSIFEITHSGDEEPYSIKLQYVNGDLPVWYQSSGAMIYQISITLVGSKPAVQRVYANDIVFLSWLELTESNTKNLLYIWDLFFNSIDIRQLTAWMPSVLSAPFIMHWTVITSLLLALLLIKIVHG